MDFRGAVLQPGAMCTTRMLAGSFIKPRTRAMRRWCDVRCAVGSLEDSDDLSVEEGNGTKWIELLEGTTQQQWTSFMELARIHNFVPSCLLVLVGAWKSVGFAWSAFLHVQVWIMALVAAGVAVGSVVVNDYFDWIAGIDTINAPEKPLPSGIIRPDIALLITLVVYVSVLVAGCIMEPPLLRRIIAFSAASTLVYTPFLKSLTLVKNLVVAAVIALSPISGALAAGTGTPGMSSLFNLAGFVFGSIVFREILMDIKDAEGDRAMRVYTLPVVIGQRAALVFAIYALSLGCLSGAFKLLEGPAAHHLSRFFPPLASSLILLSLFSAVIAPMYLSSFQIWQGNFDKTDLQTSIDRVMLYIAFGFVFIVALT